MSEAKKPYIPPDLQRLMDLGKAGKLWTIEVLYNYDHEVKRVHKRNQTSEEIRDFRENIFKYGLTLPVQEGEWEIICPYDIMRARLYRQSGYFPEN